MSAWLRSRYAWMRQNPVTLALMIGVLAVAISINAERRNEEQGRDITKIQKTPCTLHPEGDACTRIRERIARKGDLKNPCIEHQRVEGTKGRNCDRFFIPRDGEVQANSKSVQDLDNGGGGEAATGPAGGGGLAPAAGDGEGDQAPGDGNGQDDDAPAPADPQPNRNPAPTASPVAISPPPAAVDEPEQSAPEDGTSASVFESVGTAVGEALKGTGEVLQITTCGLTGPLLCPKP
ncbi:MAG TPA: hypothetical protein VEW07_11425 [Solirubrobacterales bacterium]|nr:hypothetical protein [Solirubrobacterales bacterium]